MSMTQHIRGLGIGLSALAMWSGATLAAEPPPPTAGPAAPAEPEAKDIPEAPAAGTATPIGRQVALIPEIGKCHREPLQKSILEVEKKKTGESDLALQREREDFDRIYERFRAVSLDYQGEVSKLLAETFDERQASVNRRYTKQSKEASLTVRQRRLEAITRFERFVQKYPSDAEHTPDAMFRLAELYYERSAVDFDDAEQRYATEKDLFDRGKIPSEPRSPVRDYSDSVKLYQTMLSRFGDTYRYADAVYYLLGYVLEESGQDLEARKAWLALVNRLPKSEYAPEIFLRVGENHFDYGEFAEAAEVYKRALAYTDSRFYDKALYKLAWTYFQIYDYDSAILTFKDLIA
ncbi:MAG: TolA-binding protein, partial [Myxococcota bacterium]